MKKIIFFILLLFMAFSLFLPLVLAEGIVPAGCQAGCPCTLCDLYTLGRNIIDFLLYISVSIVTLMLLWGGIEMMTSAGNTTQIDSGKKKLTSAVTGMALAFFGWIIINTLITTLGFKISITQAWYLRPECQSIINDSRSIKEGGKCKDAAPDAPIITTTPLSQGAEREKAVQQRLKEAGIRINAACPPTCVGGLSDYTIGSLIAKMPSCSGGLCLEITGGTETAGHVSHGPNYPDTVDLKYSLSAYNAVRHGGSSLPESGNFGYGITCEPVGQPGKAIPCNGSKGTPGHMHVEFR